MGKQPPSPYSAQKHTRALIENKAVIQLAASHDVRNCENAVPKAEPQEIIVVLASQW